VQRESNVNISSLPSMRARARGFTLVELMTVVIIVGILATIGIASFRRYVYGSKTTEALAMVQSIRGAEERWRAQNLTYLNVSTGGNWYPSAPVPRTKRSFYNNGTCAPTPDPSEDCRWKLLNPTVTGPVEFGYMVNAGGPSDAMTTPHTNARPPNWNGWGTTTGKQEPWFVIQAIGDSDGDGRFSKFVASSLKGEVYQEID
jgi:prepilin-type N-terminal cleavage/methylation domain-containing protein